MLSLQPAGSQQFVYESTCFPNTRARSRYWAAAPPLAVWAWVKGKRASVRCLKCSESARCAMLSTLLADGAWRRACRRSDSPYRPRGRRGQDFCRPAHDVRKVRHGSDVLSQQGPFWTCAGAPAQVMSVGKPHVRPWSVVSGGGALVADGSAWLPEHSSRVQTHHS